MCVFQDSYSLWGWVSAAVNTLSKKKAYIQSHEAMWNLMKVYILMDVGIYDFRRLFGAQANLIVDLLERSIFPSIDSELQSITQSTSGSVQFRFYLDACYNIIHSRKFATPPDGQVLSASKESELNPAY